MTSDTSHPRGRIAVDIHVGPKGTRIYGNRAFFQHLLREVEKIADCPERQYCEFQTVSLLGEREGFPAQPKVRVFGPDGTLSTTPEEVDTILMIVPDSTFD